MEILEYNHIKIERNYSISLYEKQIITAIALCVCYFGFQISDIITTFIGLQLGAVEGNPLGVNVIMIFLKMLSPCLYPFGYYIYFKVLRNKTLVFLFLVLINSILVFSYLFVLANNLRIISCLLP